MVIIKKIHIKNFRSLVDETIDFSSFNFFVGKNDSGKSNVLKALNLFFNNSTDFNSPFHFPSDYSKLAKRGSKQAKEIIISLDIVVPETFKEKGVKTWTKVWRAEGLHADNLDSLFASGSKGFTLLNRIQYMYIPAVKSNEYFKYLLSQVYLSMTRTADSSLKELNTKYSRQLQALTSDLSDQLKSVLKINSLIQMPQDLNILFRDLTFLTSDDHIKGIDLNHRGDGVKARHIPSILRYMQQNIEKNKPKNSISSSFVWGFEEPENGVEYLSCFEMADELYSYKTECQILITTHSPAFYMKHNCEDTQCFYVYKDSAGMSKYETDAGTEYINERIGFLPLVSPYIKAEQENFLKREKELSEELSRISEKFKEITGKVIIITEGKTDVKHIKIAFEHLDLDPEIISKIDYYDFGASTTLGEDLTSLLRKLSKMNNVNRIIGIFDRDKHIIDPQSDKSYTFIANNVYRFNIPALTGSERSETDMICIEHYYSDAELHKETNFGHLYLGKDFNEYGISSDGHWIFQNYSKNKSITPISIIDSSCKHLQRHDAEAKIISKDDFVDYIANHPEEFTFSNFRLIYNVICDILNDTNDT